LHAARLVGRRGYARLKVETYQGKDSNKVEFWMPDFPYSAGVANPPARHLPSEISNLKSIPTVPAGKSAKDPF
jgi:hypothetical protein